YDTCKIQSFMYHIRYHHKKSMGTANLFFICECGNESQSVFHQQHASFNIGSFTTIIRKDPSNLQQQGVKCTKCEVRHSLFSQYI
ncbi:hypothetical protein PENTCL1PPCAC_7233, partial [Pristionchus entomophagus]